MQTSQDEIKAHLAAFLTLKFSKRGEDLAKEINSPEWNAIWAKIDSESLLEVLESFSKPEGPEELSNTQGVTVLAPLDEKNKVIAKEILLKGAACFPWELDPWKFNTFLDISCLEHVGEQLAYASSFSHPYAANFLRRISRRDDKLPRRHPLMKNKISDVEEFKTYRVPTSLNKDFHPPQKSFEGKSLDFEEMSDEEYTNYFDKLYQIEKAGDLCQKSTEGPTTYNVVVVGPNVKETPIWKKILGMFGKVDATSNEISGTLYADGELYPLHFVASCEAPKTRQDGIIFTEPQKDPEKEAAKYKAKSFLFVDTSPPNPCCASSACVYIESSELDTKSELEEFIRFIEYF